MEIAGLENIEAFEKGHKDHGRFFFRFENKQQINDYLLEKIRDLRYRAHKKGWDAEFFFCYIAAREGKQIASWNGGFARRKTNIVECCVNLVDNIIVISNVFRSYMYENGALMQFAGQCEWLGAINYKTTTDIAKLRFPAWSRDLLKRTGY